MRVAALYDIHGNLPALEAVLEEVRGEGIDDIVIGGDVVPGPMPTEAITYLQDQDTAVHYLRGNGERETIAIRDGHEPIGLPAHVIRVLRWNAAQLSEEHVTWLRAWPETVRLEVDGLGPVLFCHATPRSDSEIFTRLTPDVALEPVFEGVGASVVVCGHTHMQFDRAVGRVRVVNAGSVGMPFANAGAYWLVLGPHIELRCTRYNVRSAADRILETEYPDAEEFALRDVLKPRTEAEVLASFERVALGKGGQ